MVEWTKRRECDEHSLGSKSTRAVILGPFEKDALQHFPLLGGLSKQF